MEKCIKCGEKLVTYKYQKGFNSFTGKPQYYSIYECSNYGNLFKGFGHESIDTGTGSDFAI